MSYSLRLGPPKKSLGALRTTEGTNLPRRDHDFLRTHSGALHQPDLLIKRTGRVVSILASFICHLPGVRLSVAQ